MRPGPSKAQSEDPSVDMQEHLCTTDHDDVRYMYAGVVLVWSPGRLWQTCESSDLSILTSCEVDIYIVKSEVETMAERNAQLPLLRFTTRLAEDCFMTFSDCRTFQSKASTKAAITQRRILSIGIDRLLLLDSRIDRCSFDSLTLRYDQRVFTTRTAQKNSRKLTARAFAQTT